MKLNQAIEVVTRNGKPVGGAFNLIDSEFNLVAQFKIAPLEGCNGVAILTKLKIAEPYRGKGLAKQILEYAQKVAAEMRYAALICTVKEDNEPMIRTLTRLEFKKNFDFLNYNTGNAIAMYYKII